MRRGGVVAIGVVVGWYAFALAVLHPLADAPVVDSWIYGEASRWFRATGEFRFPGFTETMPIAQVLYGAAWGAIFGGGPASLDIANVFLGIVAALLLYALVIRCGARSWQALAAAGLLICNPCFLFLSFSFMSEIPFLAALLGSHLAFAHAEGERRIPFLWLSAGLALIAFAVRPFAGAIILGSVATIVMFDARGHLFSKHGASMLVPFAVALIGCGIIWMWLTVLRPAPWKLMQRETQMADLFRVPLNEYVRMGIIGPLLYLGTVLSPLALLHVTSKNTLRALGLAAGIFVATIILVHFGLQHPSTPEMSCFGGWSNALTLRGMSNRFEWQDGWRYIVALLGSVGGAGLILAACEAIPKLTPASSAVIITAAIYWAAMLPLWFFNDRYFLVLVPAGALILALGPLPETTPIKAAAFAMTIVMGLMSLGGTYSYQRGLAAVMAARALLEKKGIARASIDAGYELNGMDLYRYSERDIESLDAEGAIPMITSSKVEDYTIAAAPFAGTEVVGTLWAPGPFGLGSRTIYVLRRIH